MTKFIGCEILTANALINEMEHNGRDYITLAKAQKYAQLVSKKLDNQGTKHVILSDRSRYEESSDYFTFDDENDLFKVNNKIDSEKLRDSFRGSLSYELLKACLEVEQELNKPKEK